MTDHEKSLFPYEKWSRRLPDLGSQYRENQPFPHIVLKGFLDDAVARLVSEEFPAYDRKSWIEYKHFNENKMGKSRREEFPPLISRVFDELNSAEFVDWLSRLIGVDDLLPDDELEGGGLHQAVTGGFLNVHADFTTHRHKTNWLRRCNLILYLNDDWQDEWGGALELWDPEMKQCVTAVQPLINRAVVFSTTEDSFHGFPEPLRCPAGVTRKSLALYYYTEEADGTYRSRSTNYRARPQDGLKAFPIWLDKTAVALYSKIKSTFGLSDDFASRVLRIFYRRPKS